MTGRRVARITRHPIKGHGREDLASVRLSAGACLPWDRHWAVAQDGAKVNDGAWTPCASFARGAKAPALMAVDSTLDEATATITLRHPDRGTITFRPDDAADLPRFLSWLDPLIPEGRARPARIVTADRGMTDSAFPSVAVLNTASLADLSARIGRDLSPHRFRGNLWLDGAAPWAEWDWIGREITVGDAVLRIEERITRCVATMVDPATGKTDADTLGTLEAAFGHQDFGLYATVVRGGDVALGSDWSLT